MGISEGLKRALESENAYENGSPERRVDGVRDELGGDGDPSCALPPAVQIRNLSNLG
jgi:hypothetical protein